VAGTRVIGMTMGDHRPINGPDRIDEEVPRLAVEPLRPGTDQILGPQHYSIMAL
jgi:hypothetical protein